MRRTLAGIMGGIALAGGGTVAADAAINPYTDTGRTLAIEAPSVMKNAGTVSAEAQKDRPAVRLGRWNDEAAFTVAYDKIKASGSRAPLSDRVEWKGAKEELHAYPLSAADRMEDGGFEVEVFLKEQPDTNVFTFAIEGAENFDFLYQPELTAEREGEVCSPTQCEINGEVTRARAENVIGSYAVYHRHLQGASAWGVNYLTGKAFHIFRPKAVDADGNTTWAELSYIDGALSVTVPETFLATATYPVRVDPTFGYTSQGASEQTLGGASTANPVFGKFTLTETADMTQISAFLRDSIGFHSSTMAVYDDDGSSGLPSTRLTTSGTFDTPSTSFAQYDESISTTGTPAGDYWLCASTNALGFGAVFIAYDSGGEMATNFENDACPSPAFMPTGGSTNKLSIFVTYTASGGGGGGGGGGANGTIFFE